MVRPFFTGHSCQPPHLTDVETMKHIHLGELPKVTYLVSGRAKSKKTPPLVLVAWISIAQQL